MTTHSSDGDRTAIVVVNYGSHELLAVNLTAVVDQRDDLLVVVVDNFISWVERAAITRLCADHEWELVASPDNSGYGAGNNLGVARAVELGATRFLLLNPDARIDSLSLARLEEAVTNDPLALVSPRIETEDGRVWFDGIDLYLKTGRTRATRKRDPDAGAPVREWLTGACLMVSRELWNRIGGFDDRYFLYWEDVDLSWRCVESGGRLLLVSEATAVHAEGGTQAERGGERVRSETYYFYNIRNRLLFAALRLDRETQRRWLMTSMTEAYDILLRGGRRQLVQSIQPWRAAVNGTIAGWRLLSRYGRTDVPGGRARSDAGRLRVLQSFPQPRPTTNPYIVMLRDSLAAHPEVELMTFSWRRALTEDFDVFHAHWPEILVSGQNAAKMAVRQLMFAILLLRLRLRRTAVVRTMHNLELPQGISRREAVLLRLFNRWTTLSIRLNTATELGERPHATIVHGHYRDWFAPFPRVPREPGRFAYFGLIRRYKAVDTLLRAFSEIPMDRTDVSLFVGGMPSTAELADELVALAETDPRICLQLRFLTDDELVRAVAAADVVVLPYREMHNSGGVLAALSLDRPVLVPDNAVNRRLADEVGGSWVHCYQPPLTNIHLEQTLVEVTRDRTDRAEERPDLSARDWRSAADQHVEAYRRAIDARRHG